MAYIFKQKLDLKSLAGIESLTRKVLIYEPEEYLGSLYEHHLKQHDFFTKHCLHLDAIHPNIEEFSPDLVVLNADSNTVFNLARKLVKNYPSLKIVTTAYNIDSEYAKKLMSLGTLSHINRKFSRPQDLAKLIITLFNH